MPTAWTTPECMKAFNDGIDAAARGATRNPRGRYLSYNEKAAFNDGWDTHTGGLDQEGSRTQQAIRKMGRLSDDPWPGGPRRGSGTA